jgi:hypothetical protein
MRKKFMMVDRLSSGMYWERIFMMLGQKMPTHASNTRNPSSCKRPPDVMLPPFSTSGSKTSCKTVKSVLKSQSAGKVVLAQQN